GSLSGAPVGPRSRRLRSSARADAVGTCMIGPEGRFTASANSLTWLAWTPEVDEALRQPSMLLAKNPSSSTDFCHLSEKGDVEPGGRQCFGSSSKLMRTGSVTPFAPRQDGRIDLGRSLRDDAQ